MASSNKTSSSVSSKCQLYSTCHSNEVNYHPNLNNFNLLRISPTFEPFVSYTSGYVPLPAPHWLVSFLNLS